jgi:hypothetical protein
VTHVLAVALNAPPKNSPESIQVGRYLSALVRAGLRVTLVTSQEASAWAPEEPALARYLVGIEVIRLPFPEKRWFVGFARRVAPPLLDLPDENAPFLLRLPLLLREIRRPPDVVYSRGLPLTSNLLGRALAAYFRVPWVMHLSDPWIDNPFHDHPLLALHRRLESSCFDRVAYATMTCEEARLHYARKYPHHAHKFLLSPNVYDDNVPDPGPPPRPPPIRIVHTGRFYGTRRPDVLLDVLDGMSKECIEVGLRVEFAGHAPPDVGARIARSVPLAVDHGPVSHEEACALQREAHVLLTIDAPTDDPRMALFFPSKLLDYMVARRLLVALTPAGSPSERIVREQGGLACPPDRPEAIAAVLREVVDRGRDGRLWTTQAAPPEIYSASYAARELAMRLRHL